MPAPLSEEWDNMYELLKVTEHDPKLLRQFLKRLSVVLPYKTEILLLDVYTREMKT